MVSLRSPRLPPAPLLSSLRWGWRAEVPFAGVCTVFGTQEEQRALPTLSRAVLGLCSQARLIPHPSRDQPGSAVCPGRWHRRRPFPAPRQAGGRPPGPCPEPARQKVSPSGGCRHPVGRRPGLPGLPWRPRFPPRHPREIRGRSGVRKEKVNRGMRDPPGPRLRAGKGLPSGGPVSTVQARGAQRAVSALSFWT